MKLGEHLKQRSQLEAKVTLAICGLAVTSLVLFGMLVALLLGPLTVRLVAMGVILICLYPLCHIVSVLGKAILQHRAYDEILKRNSELELGGLDGKKD